MHRAYSINFITINKYTISQQYIYIYTYHYSVSLYNIYCCMLLHFDVITREFHICALLSYIDKIT